MDFHSLREQYEPLIKKHWLPIFLGFLGLIFFAYGLIVLLVSSNGSGDIIFEQAEEAVKEEEKTMLVDVAGAVVSPGVYRLSSDARVWDALISAGGLSAVADRAWISKNLNLAAKLQDAAKLYIPNVGESSSGSKSSAGSIRSVGEIGQQININTASQSQLESLSGVGPVTAQKIIDGRPYSSIEELLEKKAVGNSVFEKIKNSIAVY